MRRVLLLAATITGILVSGSGFAHEEARPIVGVEMGAVQPVDAYDDFSGLGGIISPYAGFMLNDYIGIVGHVHALGTPEDNAQNRRGVRDDDATWAAGGTAGPRLALPLGKGGELWGSAEAGVMTGLAPNSSITDTSFAYNAGAGLNAKVTDQFSIGAYARWNHLFQRAHGRHPDGGEVRFISAGISLNYDFHKPHTPAAAPRVAQAPPPPAAPAPAIKKKLVLRGVNFDFDKADIRADARPVLDDAVETLRKEADVSVVAEGHTDSIGSDAYNMALSGRRAKAVRDYLVRGGIEAGRVKTEAYGESRPVASNDTEDGRAQNRRVELRVLQ